MYLCAQNHDLKRGGTFETAKAGTFHSVTAGTSIPLFTHFRNKMLQLLISRKISTIVENLYSESDIMLNYMFWLQR